MTGREAVDYFSGWFGRLWRCFFAYVESLFEEHRFVRRYIIFWATITMSLLMYRIFGNMEVLRIVAGSTPLASIVGSYLTILTASTTLYMWLRERDQ